MRGDRDDTVPVVRQIPRLAGLGTCGEIEGPLYSENP
jgi:hypothetical protein